MFKNMKISKKLIVCFIIVALISSISGILGVVLFAKSDADYTAALEDYGFAQGKIGRLGMDVNYGRAVIRDIVFLTDETEVKNAVAELEKTVTSANAALELVRPTNTSPEAKTLFAEIEKLLADYRTAREKVVALGLAGDSVNGYAAWNNEARPIVNNLADKIQELMDLNSAVGQQVSTNLTSVGQLMIGLMIGGIVVCFIISIIFALYISRGISKPIVEIEHAADSMAQGDFNVSIAFSSRDEIGGLAQSMRTMIGTTKDIISDTAKNLEQIAEGNFVVSTDVEYIGIFEEIEDSIHDISQRLSDTISQITIAAEQVSGGSEQVSAGAQSLAQGSTEQASSVQELMASVSEISSQVTDNAANAQHASKMAGIVGEHIMQSNEQMTQMMSAMTEINDSSSKISKIIKTIEDIAFQTNILALNAAVEAARAGAAGKGFAVVADEVRNLAIKSSEAAKQTNLLIEGSVLSVQNGSKMAEETAKSLSAVVGEASEITELIAKISDASHQQSASIAQVNIGVQQISSVVQTNSATSEESAAASEELSSQAALMKDLVLRFNLIGSTSSPVAKPAHVQMSNSSSHAHAFSFDKNVYAPDSHDVKGKY